MRSDTIGRPLLPPGGDFLTKTEAAALLRKAPATVDKLMQSGRLVLGVHYYKPKGSSPLFSRTALVEWVKSGVTEPTRPAKGRGPRINWEAIR